MRTTLISPDVDNDVDNDVDVDVDDNGEDDDHPDSHQGHRHAIYMYHPDTCIAKMLGNSGTFVIRPPPLVPAAELHVRVPKKEGVFVPSSSNVWSSGGDRRSHNNITLSVEVHVSIFTPAMQNINIYIYIQCRTYITMQNLYIKKKTVQNTHTHIYNNIHQHPLLSPAATN